MAHILVSKSIFISYNFKTSFFDRGCVITMRKQKVVAESFCDQVISFLRQTMNDA